MLMGISHIPIAQHHIGSFVANMVSQKLGTHITIGRVDPGFLNRIIIEDLSIWDQQKKEMGRLMILLEQLSRQSTLVAYSNHRLQVHVFLHFLNIYEQH